MKGMKASSWVTREFSCGTQIVGETLGSSCPTTTFGFVNKKVSFATRGWSAVCNVTYSLGL